MTPRVSVLLPYRDASATLDEAVSSILAQRNVALELLAVDDGSRDDGPARVARIAASDARVVPLATHGVGIVGALTLAYRHARADFLARMDGDDVAHPDRLAAQLDALDREPSLALSATQVEAFPRAAVGEGLAHYLAWQNAVLSPADHARELFVEAPVCHPSVVLRRAALEAVGGWREVPWPEDYDLWLRLDAAGFTMAKIPEVLLRWRQREGQLTFTDPRYARAQFPLAKAGFLAARLRSLQRPIAVWGAGPTGKRLARALEAHGVRAERFYDIDPRKIGRSARGVIIAARDELTRGAHTVVVAVGARGARALIRAELLERGFTEGSDFVCAA